MTTTRVYMTGDPGNAPLGKVAFYDADTGRELQVVEAQLTLTVHALPQIDFREVNSTLMQRADLVPAPSSSLPGRMLHHFAVDVERDDVRDETVVRAAWTEYEQQADGTLAPLVPALHCDERIGDIEMLQVHDPAEHLRRKIAATMGVLTHKLVDKAAATAAKNAPPVPQYRRGGVVRNAPNFGGNGPVHIAPLPPGAQVIPHNGPLRELVRPFVRDAVKKAVTQLTCDECKGTGWYQGLHRREPCSKGCKPQ